jgi:hypothetical protein
MAKLLVEEPDALVAKQAKAVLFLPADCWRGSAHTDAAAAKAV